MNKRVLYLNRCLFSALLISCLVITVGYFSIEFDGVIYGKTVDPSTYVKNQSLPDDIFYVKSVYYYSTSTFYQNNTATVLFFGSLPGNVSYWHCISKNKDENVYVGEVNVTSINDIAVTSKWKVRIASCSVVENPTEINFVTFTKPFTNVGFTIEEPVRQPRGVVACFTPMYYEKRWQALIVTHELYAAWGVDLQVHYVKSAVGDVLLLLEPFVVNKLMEIQPFDFPFTDEQLVAKKGFDVSETMKTLALQDCFLRHRESATFIITGDPEDLFLPMNEERLFDEFQHLYTLAPTAPAIATMSAFGTVYTASVVEFYSLESTLKSITFENKQEFGNLVYNPKFTDTPWILNQTAIVAPTDTNAVNIHLQYVYDNTVFDGSKSNNATRLFHLVNLLSSFKLNGSTIDFPSVKAALNELPNFDVDYKAVDMKRYLNKYDGCKNSDCAASNDDFSCDVGIEDYVKLYEGSFVVLLPRETDKQIKLQSDGCQHRSIQI